MPSTITQSIFDFEVMDIDGRKVTLDQFRGKVLLIVNTASKCGFTPQYQGLQDLYQKYSDRGLAILGFPCNQFAGQEPGDETSIKNGCLLDYQITFPMFAKVKVNGKDAHPMYKYLKQAMPGFPGNAVKWNFTKFLLDKDGKPVRRYASKDTPAKIEKDITKLL